MKDYKYQALPLKERDLKALLFNYLSLNQM